MKIGVLTLDGIANYGNRLQNYAVEEILKSMGCEVDTIIPREMSIRSYSYTIRTILEKPIRSLKFILFNFFHINCRSVLSNKGKISPKLAEKYDYFIVGSDQVWNPNIKKKQREIYFLRFANPEQRISLSASLSVDKISDEYKDMYANYISDFKNVSVREFKGAEIIKELCNKDVEVLCDPTIALEKEKWEKLIKNVFLKLPKKYLLTYFLGEYSKDRKNDIENYAKIHNMEILSLNNKCYKKIYNAGPKEFVSLIKHAELICTDSFHGVAFSSIFNKPYWAFTRESKQEIVKNMESRIISLQEKLCTEGRLVDRIYPQMEYKMDYSIPNRRIKDEQKKFKKYLSNALNCQEI